MAGTNIKGIDYAQKKGMVFAVFQCECGDIAAVYLLEGKPSDHTVRDMVAALRHFGKSRELDYNQGKVCSHWHIHLHKR
jgi:hypothetical protein